MSLYIHNRFVNSRTVQARDKAWLEVLSYEICDPYTHTHTRTYSTYWSFCFLLTAITLSAYPTIPGIPSPRPNCWDMSASQTRSRRINKAKNGHWCIYSPTSLERSTSIGPRQSLTPCYAINTMFSLPDIPETSITDLNFLHYNSDYAHFYAQKFPPA